MSMLAEKSVYSAHVLPTILYCSAPVLNISDTMTQKFEKLQEKAQKSSTIKQIKIARADSAVPSTRRNLKQLV